MTTDARARRVDDPETLFLRSASHELRTPLAVIQGLAEALQEGGDKVPPEVVGESLRKIVANSRRLDRLITDILDLDRATRGVLDARRHPADMRAMVSQAIDAVDMGGRPVEVDIEHDGEVGLVDPAQVERVLENLLVNAAHHTPPGTHVWVRVDEVEGASHLVVEDDGPGIPDEMKGSVFEPVLTSSRRGRWTRGEGLGLGLVSRFTDLHRGRTWVEDRPGGGASFHVLLPGWRAGSPAVRVLVVDWDGIATWVSSRSLAEAGYDVIRCCGPGDPRAVGYCPLLERGRCPLVDRAEVFLIAAYEPTPLFLRVLEAYRRRFPDVPCVVEVGDISDPEQHARFGGCRLVEGPLDDDRVAELLREIAPRPARKVPATG